MLWQASCCPLAVRQRAPASCTAQIVRLREARPLHARLVRRGDATHVGCSEGCKPVVGDFSELQVVGEI